MFCKNCGAQVEDGKKFCPKCGTPLVVAQAEETVEAVEAVANDAVEAVNDAQAVAEETIAANQSFIPSAPAKAPINKKMIAIIGGGIAAIAVIAIVLVLLLSGGGYEGAVKDYFKAIEKCDGKTLCKMTYPKDMIEEYIEKRTNFDDVDEMYDEASENLEDMEIESISYEIKAAENFDELKKLKSDVGYKNLEKFADDMDKRYGKFGDFDGDEITEAWAVKVKMKAVIDDEKENDTEVIIVYKYKGDWYVQGGIF